MNRVEKIKRKYGSNAFKRWGKGTPSNPGGNPILIGIKNHTLKVVKVK